MACTAPTLFLYGCHGQFATLNYTRPMLICALVQTSEPGGWGWPAFKLIYPFVFTFKVSHFICSGKSLCIPLNISILLCGKKPNASQV